MVYCIQTCNQTCNQTTTWLPFFVIQELFIYTRVSDQCYPAIAKQEKHTATHSHEWSEIMFFVSRASSRHWLPYNTRPNSVFSISQIRGESISSLLYGCLSRKYSAMNDISKLLATLIMFLCLDVSHSFSVHLLVVICFLCKRNTLSLTWMKDIVYKSLSMSKSPLIVPGNNQY